MLSPEDRQGRVGSEVTQEVDAHQTGGAEGQGDRRAQGEDLLRSEGWSRSTTEVQHEDIVTIQQSVQSKASGQDRSTRLQSIPQAIVDYSMLMMR